MGRAVSPNLNTNRPLRLVTLCVLYVSQGMPDGFVRTGLKTYLIEQGVSRSHIATLIALVGLPWTVKFVWGPIIDRYSNSRIGRRRPWILAAQFGMGLAMGSMLLIPDLTTELRMLGAMILLINCFSSMQDVAIDALAIDILPEKERGVANGLMFASSYVGAFVGGSIVGRFLLYYGVREAVALEILILGLIALFPLFVRERPGDALYFWQRRRTTETAIGIPRNASIGRTFAQLLSAFTRRASLLAAILAGCSLVTTSAFLVFWPVHVIRELGWSSERYLVLEGGYSVLFGLAGSILGGVCASWFGARRSVIIALISLSLCWLVYAVTLNMVESKGLVAPLFLAVTFLAGFYQVSMFSLFMGVCLPAVAATQFSLYMALLNVSGSAGAQFAGFASEQYSLKTVFLVLACFQLALVPFAALIDVKKITPTIDGSHAAANHLD
jgi:PAT family beta-lactamase induction signal transducer AmpG